MPPSEDPSSTLSNRASSEVSFRDSLRIFGVGLLMGSADAVPGISGGTVALIAGIYGRLIAAVTSITPRRIADLLRALIPFGALRTEEQPGSILNEFDAVFVVSLLVGIGTAVVLVGRIIEYAQAEVPVVLYGFFFGLIAASALILWRELSMGTAGRWLTALVGFTIAFVLSGEVQLLANSGIVIVFVAGAVAVSAMILPGISGSLLLIILGQYVRMYASLNDFLDSVTGLLTGGDFEAVLAPGREVVVFLVGGLVGLFTVARVIRRLLDSYREATLAFLVALVIGALRAPIAELSGNETVVWTPETIGVFVGLALVGGLLVLVLDWYAIDIDFDRL
ncbi:DUF368 domain-containing protein [Halococcus sp. IIIV-5B]|uniref:DUF368 domain-containing protein n=1 Tax=Halococcus sp. IIIV-5B TaxID=2321230 RepID=UPI000E763599|nr:DUF368 domain-containing protein [Halococcus sp. IIIV-5B]